MFIFDHVVFNEVQAFIFEKLSNEIASLLFCLPTAFASLYYCSFIKWRPRPRYIGPYMFLECLKLENVFMEYVQQKLRQLTICRNEAGAISGSENEPVCLSFCKNTVCAREKPYSI